VSVVSAHALLREALRQSFETIRITDSGIAAKTTLELGVLPEGGHSTVDGFEDNLLPFSTAFG
jgi:hypothetical protein